jgi:hypothetical protein
MPRETDALRLLKTLLGLYKPSAEEVRRLAEVAKLNKLLLAYLRRVGDVLRGELLREEARYMWFMRNATEVIEALNKAGAEYALHKFRKPFDHVSVDLDILVRVDDIPKAVKVLIRKGFEIAVSEPYTVTLIRRGFIVDLYTNPSFVWVVYMDGEKLLRCCVEEIEVSGVRTNALSREAEVVIAAAHAIYKEHMVLLIDCLTAWAWTNKSSWSLAEKLGADKALETLHSICKAIGAGYAEVPYKLSLGMVAKFLSGKLVKDSVFRATTINAFKYVFRHRDMGARILSRFLRKSY